MLSSRFDSKAKNDTRPIMAGETLKRNRYGQGWINHLFQGEKPKIKEIEVEFQHDKCHYWV